MKKTDRDALHLAMKIAREDPARAGQLDAKLADEPWHEVAEFAATCCQSRALHLKPWEIPPCDILDSDGDVEGARLLKRMLAAGVSRFHPDPMAALEQAELNEHRYRY
jgi:hypothetical protein